MIYDEILKSDKLSRQAYSSHQVATWICFWFWFRICQTQSKQNKYRDSCLKLSLIYHAAASFVFSSNDWDRAAVRISMIWTLLGWRLISGAWVELQLCRIASWYLTEGLGSPIWHLDEQTLSWAPRSFLGPCVELFGIVSWYLAEGLGWYLATGRANYSDELRAPRPLQKLNQLGVCQCTLLCQLANPLYI